MIINITAALILVVLTIYMIFGIREDLKREDRKNKKIAQRLKRWFKKGEMMKESNKELKTIHKIHQYVLTECKKLLKIVETIDVGEEHKAKFRDVIKMKEESVEMIYLLAGVKNIPHIEVEKYTKDIMKQSEMVEKLKLLLEQLEEEERNE